MIYDCVNKKMTTEFYQVFDLSKDDLDRITLQSICF